MSREDIIQEVRGLLENQISMYEFSQTLEKHLRESAYDLRQEEVNALSRLEKSIYFYNPGFDGRFDGPFGRVRRLMYDLLHDEPVSTRRDVIDAARAFLHRVQRQD